MVEKGHGRLEQREIWASQELVGYSDFPGLNQALMIKKRVERNNSEKAVETVQYAVTSLSPHKAQPQRLLKLVRGHWCIENRLFHVKDDSFGEDRQVLQSRSSGSVLSLLRNTALNLLRGPCELWKQSEPLTGRAQRLCAKPITALGSTSRL